MTSKARKKVGVLGASGYTGGELIRLLIHHPEVELTWLFSRSLGGVQVSKVHRDLLPYKELEFTDQAPPPLDILFLCAGHGVSETWLNDNPQSKDTLVIDLSSDFRLNGKNDFIYGLPEWQRGLIRGARRIANPGCFATAIQLGIFPFIKNDRLPETVTIQATTGSTGAGQSLSGTTHFTWRANNLSVYKAFQHQHMGEIRQLIHAHQPGHSGNIPFIPQRGDFTRGIMANIIVPVSGSLNEWMNAFHEMYDEEPFVHVTREEISLKEVVNTNHAFIQLQAGDGHILVTSIIDNLLKGASGQAVQNMNLAMGWEETCGLHLKPLAY